MQYRAVLDRDPHEIEALLNLAYLHAARGEDQAAYSALQRLVASAPQSRHPQRDEFTGGAQLVLDGEIKLEEFEAAALIGPLSSPALRPAPRPPSKAGRGPRTRQKRKKRKR